MKNNTIILDFDRTLFDTNSFLKGLTEIFLENGVKKNDFDESYKISKPYDIKLHLSNLNINDDRKNLILKDSVAYLKQMDRFLFSDTMNFMDFLEKRGFKKIMVTYGANSLQTLKLKYTGLYKRFDIIRITQKPKYYLYKNIITNFINDNIYLVDDLKENTNEMIDRFPNIYIIKINHNNSKDIKANNRFFNVSSLKDVQNIIQNLSKNQ